MHKPSYTLATLCLISFSCGCWFHFGPGGPTSVCYKAQAGTGNSMLVDGGDAGGAAAMNLMEEDRVGMFGGRSKRRR